MNLLYAMIEMSDMPRLPGRLRRLQANLQRLGAGPIVMLGFVGELGWAIFGSIGLGLGARPSVASETAARLWAVGAVVLAVLVGLMAWIATPTGKRPD